MAKNPSNLQLKSGRREVDGNVLENELLLDLPDKECQAVYSQLVFMPLRTHDVLNEAAAPIQYAYFIESGLASVLNVMEDGKSVEVGLTGKEGFVGLPLLVGFTSSPSRVIMQIDGSGFRISAKEFAAALTECPALEKSLQRFSQEMG